MARDGNKETREKARDGKKETREKERNGRESKRWKEIDEREKKKKRGRERGGEGRVYRVWLLIVAQNSDCNIAFLAQTSLLWGSVGEAVYL